MLCSCIYTNNINRFRVTKECEVGEYVIPKDSFAMANLWGFMKDPAVWPEAEVFRPERFLEETEAGELRLVRHERFVPFGLGRRICMGMSLASDTLFIFMTTLVKSLKFDNPLHQPKPDPANFTDGFTVIPHPYYVNIKRR